MMRYNHTFFIGFTCITKHPEGEDVTPAQLREAILKRLAGASDGELLEACGAPFDTYEVEPDNIPTLLDAAKAYLAWDDDHPVLGTYGYEKRMNLAKAIIKAEGN